MAVSYCRFGRSGVTAPRTLRTAIPMCPPEVRHMSSERSSLRNSGSSLLGYQAMTADGHRDGHACKRDAKAQLMRSHTSIHDAELRRGVASQKAPWLPLKQRETYYNLRLGYRLPYRMNENRRNRETSYSKSISISHSAGNTPRTSHYWNEACLAGRLSSEDFYEIR